ncbi:MAG: carbon starvation protein A [Planctomycetota bacterium]|nr:carbon starvation protein A [Planctomycetota bacterium]
MNSLWLIITALAAFAVAYRYYSAFLAAKVAVLDNARITPAHRLRDGVDYHPTHKLVLFGHHFAAIAGPGPLIGPVLAAQWGFFPGFAWIIVGACLAGGVHDFVVLWASVRNDGLSLSRIAGRAIGPVSGMAASVATLFIVVCTLASVAYVVVNALSHSSWGMFTIIVTIPAALLTGLWMYKIRPGKIGEASAIGVAIVMAGVFLGQPFKDSSLGSSLLFSHQTLSILLPVYACIASMLPVWVLMCPRDYLSSYMKIGVMVVLTAGLIIAHPDLTMPAVTPFLAGGGPIISGPVWPFICIVIMCGAISGFHSLIASGTTPKMVYREKDIRLLGYGAMILEGFVALAALVAACALQPGDYFAINVAQDTPAAVKKYDDFTADMKVKHQWDLQPRQLTQLEQDTEETLRGRTGGAVTLAVGMAKVFSDLPGMKTLTSYWYHFVIMFEALFILTLLETGTRVGRFVFQETFAQFVPKAAIGGKPNWTLNCVMSVVICGAWGGLLYIGNLETLWRMLGISNQLLASIALAVGTTCLLVYTSKRRYALLTGIPLVFVLATVETAGVMSVRDWWTLAVNPATAPDKVFLLKLAAVLGSIMLALTIVIAADAVRKWISVLRSPRPAPPAVQAAGER